MTARYDVSIETANRCIELGASLVRLGAARNWFTGEQLVELRRLVKERDEAVRMVLDA